MRRPRRSNEPGSVIVMVTMAILLLFAMMGLVVDIGWAYFQRRAAQVAADAAAQAGAQQAFETAQAASPPGFSSLGPDNTDVLNKATTYAQLNGFIQGGDSGRQTVQIKSNSGPYPGLEKLQIMYWVQARVTSRVNSLFPVAGSALESGAVAVAAVLQSPVEFSVYLLNRACDPAVQNCGSQNWDDVGIGQGVNFKSTGGGKLTAGGGLKMNSSADGGTGRNYSNYAAYGAENITTSYLELSQDGKYQGKPSPTIPYGIGPQLADPTLTMNFGKQPRVQTVQELAAQVNPVMPIVYGVTAGSLDGATLGPGVYVSGLYSMNAQGVPKFTFSDQPINLTNVTFNSGGKPGTYIFLGGVRVVSATFDQGVYVMAGAGPKGPGTALSMDNPTAKDGAGNKTGDLFLLTRPDYLPDRTKPASATNPRLLDPSASYWVQPIGLDGKALPAVPAYTSFASVASYPFGGAEITSGQGQTDINLSGLKGRAACTPDQCGTPSSSPALIDQQLYLYQPALIWQDRRNCFSLTSSIPGCLGNSNTASFKMGGTGAGENPFGGFTGMLYQPRGSLLSSAGPGARAANLVIITGAMSLGPGADIALNPLSGPPGLKTVVALVR